MWSFHFRATQQSPTPKAFLVGCSFNCFRLPRNSVVTPLIYPSIAARGGGGSFKREKIYNSEEHVPIESFGTTLIH